MLSRRWFRAGETIQRGLVARALTSLGLQCLAHSPVGSALSADLFFHSSVALVSHDPTPIGRLARPVAVVVPRLARHFIMPCLSRCAARDPRQLPG